MQRASPSLKLAVVATFPPGCKSGPKAKVEAGQINSLDAPPIQMMAPSLSSQLVSKTERAINYGDSLCQIVVKALPACITFSTVHVLC